MRVSLLFLAGAIGCGGVINDPNGNHSTADASDGSDPFRTGRLLTGSCQISSSFTPYKMAPMPLWDSKLTSTATRMGPTQFELVCAGSGTNLLYYVLDVKGIVLQAGSAQMLPSTMTETNSGAHDNPQMGVGTCNVIVAGITHAADGDTANGTVDCPNLWDDPLGGYAMKGPFTVPLP